MKALYLHHLGVPCIATPRIQNDVACGITDIYYLNPAVLIRKEPGGALLTPPMLYSSFLMIDEELLALLQAQVINPEYLSKSIFEILTENLIIQKEKPINRYLPELEVAWKGLPSQVLFEVTSACNCNCVACYHADDLGNHYPEYEDLKGRIDKLKSLGVGLFEVTGGEPFLRDDLYDILNYIHTSGLHYYVVTNGGFLSEVSFKMIELLKNSLGVAVSLDGIGEVHDNIRQSKGLYDKIILGLDRLFSEGVEIFLISTLNSYNFLFVEEMIAVARKYKTTLHLRPTIHTGNAKHNMLEKDDLRLRQELQPFLKDRNVRNGLLSTKKSIPPAEYYGCGIRKRISVDSKGFLYPCVMDRSRKLNDIMDYSPEELLTDLEQETNSFLRQHVECSQCEINKKAGKIVCGGFCRFSKKHNKGLKQ